MRGDFDQASALIGQQIRAVIEGTGESVIVVDGRRLRSPYRIVVTGEAVGWRTLDGGIVVDIAGTGQSVPLEVCRRRRWWHR